MPFTKWRTLSVLLYTTKSNLTESPSLASEGTCKTAVKAVSLCKPTTLFSFPSETLLVEEHAAQNKRVINAMY
ncbi:hypothetical protein ACVWYG_003465 [Pedobacter sp. UYEF25]